ncbi:MULTISPECIES: hypothetical protein [Vibrio]|uniref:hypothetical protein n=1 Tax=Vibrio TaxID=662 RepID=UPI000BFF846B|nr:MULTISPECIES: hypothetical protein [unclassified Vibrio]PHJ40186.1 hypothetical protein AK965_18180 [Vibrio sp. PID17_43]RIZ55254.1 hypothetical protein AK966_07975 [Vibrio sp. PID23_8]
MNKYKSLIIAIASLFSTACSNQQAAQLGMRSSSVNVYAQQMSSMQLCETLYYKRPSNQTRVAIGAEFNRRGLSKRWCDQQYQQLYVEKIVNEMLLRKEQAKTKPEVTIQPAI